ncbi:MAG: CRISPR-associated endonuclease Cas2 [Bacteroidales bacterium]|nr:CRISPR-associated endonuclease Cas2 [Bacteroidales bacterium]
MGRARKHIKPKTFVETILLIKKAGLKNAKIQTSDAEELEKIDSINERIEKILGVYKHYQNKPGQMLYFIMYDIENDKVRQQIAKYLIKKGCIRVQKSIFIAESDRKKYDELNQTLKEVQAMYDNNDSIFFVPISVDELRAMKIIGRNVDFSMVINPPNTLFF